MAAACEMLKKMGVPFEVRAAARARLTPPCPAALDPAQRAAAPPAGALVRPPRRATARGGAPPERPSDRLPMEWPERRAVALGTQLQAWGPLPQVDIVSAHRTPDKLVAYARGAHTRGLEVGGSARTYPRREPLH